jgi:hypothetical protein
MKSPRNPVQALRKDLRRSQVETTVGMTIFVLGPSGEGDQFSAAEIDKQGNIVECAQFDVNKFDESTFCD